MTDKLYEELLVDHYDEIYEQYCKRHPEEITSDFILDENGNEDYIKIIMEELYMNGEFISIETARIMADIEKENKELQEQNKILQEKLNDAREYISAQKDEIKELKELCDKYEEEHKTTFKLWTQNIMEGKDE